MLHNEVLAITRAREALTAIPAIHGRGQCDHCKGYGIVWQETISGTPDIPAAMLIRACEFCHGSGFNARRYITGHPPRHDRNGLSRWERFMEQVRLWIETR